LALWEAIFIVISHRKPKKESMKSLYLCLVVFCATIAIPGCGETKETKLATEGVTADDIAKYEADLAAVSGEDSYAEELNDDDDAGTGDAGTEAAE
jgi:hypothetical protein